MKLIYKKTGKEFKNRKISHFFGITRLPQDFYLEIKNAVRIDVCGKNTYVCKADKNMTIMDIKRYHIPLS